MPTVNTNSTARTYAIHLAVSPRPGTRFAKTGVNAAAIAPSRSIHRRISSKDSVGRWLAPLRDGISSSCPDTGSISPLVSICHHVLFVTYPQWFRCRRQRDWCCTNRTTEKCQYYSEALGRYRKYSDGAATKDAPQENESRICHCPFGILEDRYSRPIGLQRSFRLKLGPNQFRRELGLHLRRGRDCRCQFVHFAYSESGSPKR